MRSRTTRLVACALITQFFSLSTISISRTRDSRKQRRAPQNQDAATGVLATAEIPFALINRHRQFWRQQPSVSILSICCTAKKAVGVAIRPAIKIMSEFAECRFFEAGPPFDTRRFACRIFPVGV